MNIEKSITAHRQAVQHIPGGVNSPVRAFKSVGGNPLYIQRAAGSKLWDIDGNQYIDYVGSWGPMIVGHAHPRVIAAITEAAQRGTSYGAPTLAETEMALLIKQMVPSVEMVRMVNSGTEATMSALRIARGYTRRNKVVKFDGCYHGHADSFLIKAGSGALTLGLPDSPGVTPATAADTLIAPYNDLDAVVQLFEKYGNDIAAIIVEPVVGNMGVLVPRKGFLQGLRDVCTQYGAVLIFDEVMTGFRLARGGAQELYGIKPDITTMGKIIGGGLPVGAYGGRKDIMEMLAPAGPVYQAGTLSGNPLAMTAGLVTLQMLNNDLDFYSRLEQSSAAIEKGLRKILTDLQFPAVINRVGSMFTMFFSRNEKIETTADTGTADRNMYGEFFRMSLESGIYLAPSQFEAAFVSAAHTPEDVQKTLQAAYNALEILKKK